MFAFLNVLSHFKGISPACRSVQSSCSALHCAAVLRGAICDNGIQRRALLADAAARGDEICIAPLVREGVGRTPG